MIRIKIKFPYIIVLVIILVTTAFFFFTYSKNVAIGLCDNYKWTNPRLACDEKPIISKAVYDNFKVSLVNRITTWKTEGKVEKVAVFFRDLENGPTFGIDEKELFTPASLPQGACHVHLFQTR
jgi:hypothetical protein